MSEYESISYQPQPELRTAWKPEKERLKDFVTVTASVRREAVVPPIEKSSKHPQAREIPLHSLLEYGAIFLAITCALSLGSWALDIQTLVILSPFVAFLVMFMSPFLYLMGRAARVV